MKVVFGIGKIKKIARPVVTLGVFDGIHLGHLRILRDTVRYAKKIDGKSVVITFFPHPQSKLNLYPLDMRIRLFRKIGIDICIVVKFTDSFSKISASDFIRDFLIKKIQPEYIFVGENFTFGKNARGNPLLLLKYTRIYNFKLKIFPVYKLAGKAISSTSIRQLIIKGRLFEAARLLGRPVSISGTVVKGSRLAGYLGFPTANVRIHQELLLPSGVFLAKVIFHDKKFNGICYIGGKPTFESGREKSLPLFSKSSLRASSSTIRILRGGRKQNIHVEVHIFRFNKNAYGKQLEIQFIKKIREERKFASVLLLVEQIKNDIKLAKTYFRQQ